MRVDRLNGRTIQKVLCDVIAAYLTPVHSEWI